MKDRVCRKEPGAVMVFALVLMTAGVFVLAAVLQLAATQGISGDAEWAAVQRRVTLGNSRAMAREYMHSRIFRGPVPADTNAGSVTFTNGLGGFSIQPAGSMQTNYWAALSTTNTDVVLNINPFNLMERGGFYREVFVGQLQEGGGTTAWSFALRTRSPVAAGYSFVQHRPANNDLASLATPPYIDMNDGGVQFYGFYGLPRMPLSSVTNTMTRGTGDGNGYQGFLDVPQGFGIPGLFDNVSFRFRHGSSNELCAVLDLSARHGGNPHSETFQYVVASNAVVEVDGVPRTHPLTEVELIGASQFDDPRAVHVIASIDSLLTYVTLSGDNERRIYLYRQKAANDGVWFDISSTNASRWRLGITASQSNIQFELGNIDITGGLRTDGEIRFQGAIPNFTPEEDPGGLDFIADRMMWLEDYRAQQ